MTDNQAMEITEGLAEQLSALAERITPGEWRVEADMRSERTGDMWDTEDGYREYLAGWNIRTEQEEIIGCEGIIPGGSAEANAEFSALVRNNLPAIIAALSRPATPAAGDAEVERVRIVAWLRERGAMWERLSRKSDARGPEYADISHSQAMLAASYRDHADAIERGDHHA